MTTKPLKFTFVILHYNTPEVTINCIESIKRLQHQSIVNVVVVDNNSPDGSGVCLQRKYKYSQDIVVILNKENAGFASGNNIGYEFARDKLNSDVIFCLNNDIEITDSEFISKLENNTILSKYHIISPDIINRCGIHQSPLLTKLPEKKQIQKSQLIRYVLRVLYSIPVIGELKIKLKKSSSKKKEQISIPLEDIVPHGAFVIYTPLWVEKESFAFYPGTFMYFEELLLAKYCNNNRYKIIFYPEIYVKHLEDVSTNSVMKKVRKKALFQTNNSIKSCKLLLKLYN